MSEDSTIYNTNINVGAPPLLWSTVNDAFRQVNANFEILAATLGSAGVTPLNFNDLGSSVKPAESNVFQLGDPSLRWKNLYVNEYSEFPDNELNGVWLGAAQIRGIGGTIDLPSNSTVNGDLIINPDKTFFKTIKVTGDRGGDIVAAKFNDDLKINSGLGIEVSIDSSSESLVIDSTGIISATAGAGIAVSGTDPLLIENIGVVSLGPVTALPSGLAAGTGIAVSTATGTPTITNTGIVGLTAGYGIQITPDASTGISDIAFNVAVAPQAAFVTIQSPGQTPLLAVSTADVLIIEGTGGIEITTSDPPLGNATISFNFNNRIDIIGSVFSDDSTMMVDATNGTFLGDLKGSVVADDSTILVDAVDGKVLCDVVNSSVQTDSLVVNSSGFINFNGSNVLNGGTVEAIILQAGDIGVTGNIEVQGELIGKVKGNVAGDITGSVFADDSTMLVDGTDGKIVGPVENSTVTTSTLSTGVLLTNLIESADSSEIQIIPSVNVNSDLTVGGDILPSTNLGSNLGSPTHRFKDLYLSGTTINLGGATISADPSTGSVQFAGSIVDIAVLGVSIDGSNPSTTVNLSNVIGPFPEGVIISESSGNGTAVYSGILDGNDFLIGINLISPGAIYIDAFGDPIVGDQLLATGSTGANAAYILNEDGVPVVVGLPNRSGTFANETRTSSYTQSGSTLSINWTKNGNDLTVNSVSQNAGFDSTWALSNNTFYVDFSDRDALVPGTADEFQIQFNVAWNVNTNVVGAVNVIGEVSTPGARFIDLDELKAIVAASSDFDDFKSRIAALF